MKECLTRPQIAVAITSHGNICKFKQLNFKSELHDKWALPHLSSHCSGNLRSSQSHSYVLQGISTDSKVTLVLLWFFYFCFRQLKLQYGLFLKKKKTELISSSHFIIQILIFMVPVIRNHTSRNSLVCRKQIRGLQQIELPKFVSPFYNNQKLCFFSHKFKPQKLLFKGSFENFLFKCILQKFPSTPHFLFVCLLVCFLISRCDSVLHTYHLVFFKVTSIEYILQNIKLKDGFGVKQTDECLS